MSNKTQLRQGIMLSRAVPWQGAPQQLSQHRGSASRQTISGSRVTGANLLPRSSRENSRDAPIDEE
jgi:hypothetical protein